MFLSVQVRQTNGSSDGTPFGTVSFFANARLVGSQNLSRPVTDCFNGLEGPLVGDFGMELMQVYVLLLVYACAMAPLTWSTACWDGI